MSSIFNQLLNVKGTVVEDVRIVDSPLRPEPVLEVRVRPRAPLAWPGLRGCWRVELVAAMPRVDCPRCGVVVASVPWAEPGSRFTRDFCVLASWRPLCERCFSAV